MTPADHAPFDAEDEALLARIVAGEIALEAPEVRALVARRPQIAAEIELLRRAAREVAQAGAREREAIEGARAATTAEDRRRVAASLSAHLDAHLDARSRAARPESPSASASPVTTTSADAARTNGARASTVQRSAARPWRQLAAAAVLVAFAGGAAYLALRDRAPVPPTMMSGDEVLPTSPIGDVESFGVFEWTGPTRPGSWYEVVVLDERGEIEITRSERVRTNRWEPKPDETARFPAVIRWKVIPGAGTTPSGASASVVAKRRSR